MCGIVGYIGKRQAAPLVVPCLKNLEYRGYDSCGLAVLERSGLILNKDIGKINEVFSKIHLDKIPGNIAIAHTRWATHGKVTQKNSHPHLSNNKKIAVVHNGIIENYQELKTALTNKGFKFYSETDTEIIPNLIEWFMRSGKSFSDSVKETLKKLKGSYAMVILYDEHPGLIAARKDSPLVIGIGDKEYFVASDIPAFLEHTKKVIYLEDGDIISLDGEIDIFNIKAEMSVKRPISTVEWDIEQAQKGEFDHFMLKEIAEQAEVIKKAIEQDKKIIDEIAEIIKNSKGVYFVACGTAFHACLAGMYKFSKIAKTHINVALASEFPNYVDFLTPKSLVIAISQSGETADTLGAIRAAKEKGARVISIINVMGSSLMRESEKTLLQHSGPEISVLATKSYTSQLAILILLAYAIAGKFDEAKLKLKDLIKYIYYLTSQNTRDYIKRLAEKLRYVDHIYAIGRDLQYPTALETALKIKEVSYIHCEGFAGGELKHGPIALIEYGTPCIVFSSKDTQHQIIGNAEELKARGAYIIGVGPENNEVFDFFIKVREAEEVNSICQIIPMQILAYQLAILRGCDPDKPKNLAKSVTVK